GKPVEVLDHQERPLRDLALLDQLEEPRERVAVGVLAVLTEEGAATQIVQRGRFVEARAVAVAPCPRGLGLPPQTVASGLLGVAETDVTVHNGDRIRGHLGSSSAGDSPDYNDG